MTKAKPKPTHTGSLWGCIDWAFFRAGAPPTGRSVIAWCDRSKKYLVFPDLESFAYWLRDPLNKAALVLHCSRREIMIIRKPIQLPLFPETSDATH